MNMLRKALSLEEEDTTGVAAKEIEYTFYGRIVDFLDLKRAATKEHHEQWELKIPRTDDNAAKGTIRVRKTIPDIIGAIDPEYVLTTKTIYNEHGDRIETGIPSTKDQFEQFKLLSIAGMIKDRYSFPIEGSDIVWEIDVFYLPGAEVGSGKYLDWCKIDLEVKNRDAEIPPFPIHLVKTITNQDGNYTEEEEEKVKWLYENDFVTKNKRRD